MGSNHIDPDKSMAARIALWQTLILAGLCVVAFRTELPYMWRQAISNPEAAHLIALPVLLGIMYYQRRNLLHQHCDRGSTWGLLQILLSLAIFAIATWPFNYGYPRHIALVLAMAGVVLLAGGWPTLRASGPLLLLLLVCLPIGARQFSRLIIAPETYTLTAAHALLNLLPGVFVSLDGPDLSYVSSRGTGAIALGEPHRGASLFMAYTAIGIFVTFLRCRPGWQIVTITIAAIPVAMLCNLTRVLIHALATIMVHANPLNGMPRTAAAIVSILIAYGVYTLLLACLNRITVPAPDLPQAPVAAPPPVRTQPVAQSRQLFSVSFVIAAAVLAGAAVTLAPALQALIEYYSKLPIDLRRPLDDFNDIGLPSFKPANGPIEMVFAYGDAETDQVLMRAYESTKPSPATRQFKNAMLLVTYYSDPRAQIPHTPEVCYRQKGDVVTHIRSEPIEVPELGPDTQTINTLGIDVSTDAGPITILYVFSCNGKFYNNRARARFAIGWPGDKYTYFSKVEAIARYSSEDDYDDAVQTCRQLLRETLPLLIKDHYPKSSDLQRR